LSAGWLNGFLHRNESLSRRYAENISKSSARVSIIDLQRWHEHLRDYFVKNNLMDILLDPKRILNADETAYAFFPKLGRVFFPKKEKKSVIIKRQAKKKIVLLC
jgi:hypothetical protein